MEGLFTENIYIYQDPVVEKEEKALSNLETKNTGLLQEEPPKLVA